MIAYIIGATDPTEMSTASFKLHANKVRCTYSLSESLRTQISLMMQCETVCLLDGWWADRNAMCLQTIAAWLGMKVIDVDGNTIPTSSLKG